MLGLADQRRRHERDHPGDQTDDDQVEQDHGDDSVAFEDREYLHPVDHRCEQQGDDRGEDEQQEDVEQMDDEVLTLVVEHHHRKRDQHIDQDADGALEVPPGPQ